MDKKANVFYRRNMSQIIRYKNTDQNENDHDTRRHNSITSQIRPDSCVIRIPCQD